MSVGSSAGMTRSYGAIAKSTTARTAAMPSSTSQSATRILGRAIVPRRVLPGERARDGDGGLEEAVRKVAWRRGDEAEGHVRQG